MKKAANDLLDEVEKAILECVYCYATKGKRKGRRSSFHKG